MLQKFHAVKSSCLKLIFLFILKKAADEGRFILVNPRYEIQMNLAKLLCCIGTYGTHAR